MFNEPLAVLEEEREPLRVPWMVIGLVVVNGLGWLMQLRHGDAFTNALAAVPYELSRGVDLTGVQYVPTNGQFLPVEHAAGPYPIYLTLVSSMFLHASWAHLIGNMIYLCAFGVAIERRTGPWRFFTFYVACGLVAGAAHALSVPDSMLPMVGASGAISGILGAYVLTFPLNEVAVGMPLVARVLSFGSFAPRLPAVAVFGVWLLMQWLGYLTAGPGAGGVAFMSHIGGFLSGLLLAAFLVPNAKPKPPRRHGWVSY